MKKIIALLLAFALMSTLTACSIGGIESAGSQTTTPAVTAITTATATPADQDSDDASDEDYSDRETTITLGDKITIDGAGAIVEGSTVSITSSGTYYISGTLKDGQIRVYTKDSGTVRLVLNGADITCSASAPIYIINSEKTAITLADGSENYLTDATSYVYENAASDEPDAAVFSNDDLTINGGGALTVNANYNDGIKSDDDLKITGGDITVNAMDDGVIGRDSLTVKNGNITINAGGDGMKASNDEDEAQGYIVIEGGTINITAGTDGIQAETSVTISGGEIMASSGGGSANASTDTGGQEPWGQWGNPNQNDTEVDEDTTGSAKAIKAGVDITITGGDIEIDSSDDSIHSNDTITITGGNIVMASGDDGVHADSSIEINGGDIRITKSYEGMESAAITINGGDIHITSSDDGINVVGGVDGSSMGGRPGQNEFNYSEDNYLYINGGYIVIDAAGDGIDVNGPIDMTSGVVIINGPTNSMNGALDYLGSFTVSGGFLVAVGSYGMAQAPGTSSSQLSASLTFSSVQSGGTMFHIETEGGEEILTFVPTKAYQSVVLCSPDLESGVTYIAYSGGSSTGTVRDGLYSGGTYTPGTEVGDFTK